MSRKRKLLGALAALGFGLPAGVLTWWLTARGSITAPAGLAALLLARLGWTLGTRGREGAAVPALLVTLAVLLPGLWLGYAEAIRLENAELGCTFAEALELVPAVLSDPGNRVQVLWDLLSPLGLALLALWLAEQAQAPRN